ncbi:MAG: CHAT domain-containing protein [Planctomycetota bacterium]|jgi:tetratricopeptide (TPR) repeat protein
MRIALAVPVALLVATALLAQDKPRPDTPEQAADKVLAALEAKDQEALKALAERDEPDPWLVADELCFRGEHDAAKAFAKAAPRKDVDKLPAYVASRRGKPPNVAARKALAAANKAFRARDAKAAFAALHGVEPKAADVVTVRLLFGRGIAFRSLRRLRDSAQAYATAAALAERIGWLGRAGAALHESGMSAYYRSDWRGALAAWERRLAIEESRRNRTGVAATLGNIGNIHRSLGAYARALGYLERALKIFGELGNRAGVAAALGDIGNIHRFFGAYGKALDYQERALRLKEELGDRAGVALTLGNIGLIHGRLDAYAKALDYQERSLKLSEELGDRAGVARALGNIGNIHACLGAYVEALEYQERALEIFEELGNRAGVAATLGNIGNIHVSLGAYAKALDYQERSLKLNEELGKPAGVAATLGNIGAIHESLGAYAKALDYQKRSLELREELGDRAGVAATLGNIGLIHECLGAYAKALDYQKRSLKRWEELGDRAGVAGALGSIGNIHLSLGAYAKALDYQERSLKIFEELGIRAGVATFLGSIGLIHESLGAHAKALEYLERALALAAELGSLETEVVGLWNLAVIHLALQNPAEAARAARRGIEKLPALVGRLGEEQGATARDRWAGLLENGVRAGMQLGDPAEVSFFMESGRAGALLESLGGREALGGVAVPEALRRAEIAARAAVLAARARHGRALEAGDLTKIRTAHDTLEEAHGKVLEVVSKIQRDAKAAADVKYPKAAALKDIQKSLAKNEALVQYALLSEEAVALVVTAATARIAPLGETKDIEAACAALRAKDKSSDPSGAISALRRKVGAPLGLDKGTTRLLVSPHGLLASVPFALLVSDREVVMVPSGTTYGVLLDERRKRGERVLSLGDPDYGVKADRHTLSVIGSGARLVPLPGTRAEAKAVGDVHLLGRDASETEFRMVASSGKRWRAVHLACHGLIRTDQPQLSSLALTPSAKDDGFLTVLEVFGMKIPTDLVVLSACETARGKTYRAEGIVGFTRSFMFAGAPRVIVSLWKVDDEATRALMVRFYELWNPKGGSKGLPAATALKKAQEYVRDLVFEQVDDEASRKAGREVRVKKAWWKHPYYWAAWQLWGLPD